MRVCIPNYRGGDDAPCAFMSAADFTVFFQTNKDFFELTLGSLMKLRALFYIHPLIISQVNCSWHRLGIIY